MEWLARKMDKRLFGISKPMVRLLVTMRLTVWVPTGIGARRANIYTQLLKGKRVDAGNWRNACVSGNNFPSYSFLSNS